MNIRVIPLLAAIALLLTISQSVSLSCPVCFGAEGDPATNGLNYAIMTLLGVTGTVLAGFVSFFIRLKKRSRTSTTGIGEG